MTPYENVQAALARYVPGLTGDQLTLAASIATVASGVGQARDIAVALEQENARLWQMVECSTCGKPALTEPDRQSFLDHGAHEACVAELHRDFDTLGGVA